MWTSTTGSETISLGSAVTGFLSFANAGAAEGDIVSYGITDGDSREVGIGTYSSASATLTRDTIRDSTNSGSRITLTGSAYVYGNVGSEDLEINQTGGIVQVELHNETLSGSGIFDVSSISQDYDHLIIRLISRSDVVATSDIVYMYFNNDTTSSNYHHQHIAAYDGANSGNNEAANAFISQCTSASAPANSFGGTNIVIALYTNVNTNKIAINNWGHYYDTQAANASSGVMTWLSTSAINRITIQPDGYSTDNFIAGSWLQIIGVKTVT